MSKLQNENVYITGIAYSLTGCAEVGSLAYLAYIYLTSPLYTSLQLLLFIVAGSLIYGLNLFSLIIVTPSLLSDV